MKKIVVTLVSVLSLAFVLNGCGGGGDGSASTGDGGTEGDNTYTEPNDPSPVYSSNINKPSKIGNLPQVPMPDEKQE